MDHWSETMDCWSKTMDQTLGQGITFINIEDNYISEDNPNIYKACCVYSLKLMYFLGCSYCREGLHVTALVVESTEVQLVDWGQCLSTTTGSKVDVAGSVVEYPDSDSLGRVVSKPGLVRR